MADTYDDLILLLKYFHLCSKTHKIVQGYRKQLDDAIQNHSCIFGREHNPNCVKDQEQKEELVETIMADCQVKFDNSIKERADACTNFYNTLEKVKKFMSTMDICIHASFIAEQYNVSIDGVDDVDIKIEFNMILQQILFTKKQLKYLKF